jgi:hypothetical protein
VPALIAANSKIGESFKGSKDFTSIRCSSSHPLKPSPVLSNGQQGQKMPVNKILFHYFTA